MTALTIIALTTMQTRLQTVRDNEDGFSTAELLANAALGVAALVIIWAAMTGLGERVVLQIGDALGL